MLQADLAITTHQEPPQQHACSLSLGACLCKALLTVQPQLPCYWHLLIIPAIRQEDQLITYNLETCLHMHQLIGRGCAASARA